MLTDRAMVDGKAVVEMPAANIQKPHAEVSLLGEGGSWHRAVPETYSTRAPGSCVPGIGICDRRKSASMPPIPWVAPAPVATLLLGLGPEVFHGRLRPRLHMQLLIDVF